MNYSKTHQDFARHLDNQDALTNPEQFLGPNYRTVLDFWWWFESQTKTRLQTANNNYSLKPRNRDYNKLCSYCKHFKYHSDAIESTERIGNGIVGQFCSIAAPVVLEIMAMDIIIEKGESLLFIPLLSFE